MSGDGMENGIILNTFKRMFSFVNAYLRGAKANDFPYSKYGLLGERLTDPVHNCEVHNFAEGGCFHVDGFLCDFPECAIRTDYLVENERK